MIPDGLSRIQQYDEDRAWNIFLSKNRVVMEVLGTIWNRNTTWLSELVRTTQILSWKSKQNHVFWRFISFKTSLKSCGLSLWFSQMWIIVAVDETLQSQLFWNFCCSCKIRSQFSLLHWIRDKPADLKKWPSISFYQKLRKSWMSLVWQHGKTFL